MRTLSDKVEAVIDRFMKEPPRIVKIVEGVAGQMFSFAPDAILELAASEKRWPDPIAGWLTNPREDGTFLAVPLDAVPGWCKRTVKIDDTFRSTPPAPQPRPEMIDQAEIQARFDLTPEAFAAALELGFPQASMTRYDQANGILTQITPLWNADKVAAWWRRQSVLGGNRG